MNAPLLPAMREQTRVAFVNDRRRFAGLVTRGAILQIVTFGFYRFWLATDIRRHLWSHTAPGGDPLEYLGTAKDLLIGFLVGLAILAPVYFLYFLAGLAAESVQAFASVPFLLFLIVFRDFARYRGQRYRLRRTVWRGLAFSMDGSGWSYALRSALWGLLVIVTFGLALPWRLAALERYKMEHVCYGDVRARFDATGGGLFRAGWTLWLWVALYVALLAAVGNFGRGFTPGDLGKQILLFLVAFVATLLMPIVLAAYKARIWRWWASGVSFGGARLSSDLDGESFVMIYYKTGLAFIGLIFAGVAGAVLLFSGRGGVGAIFTPGAGGASLLPMLQVAGFYMLLALVAGILVRIFLTHDMWRVVAASLSIANLDRLHSRAAAAQDVSALGEGLSDGFDLAG